MAKVVSIRERVHQPFWDTLIRTAGFSAGNVGDQTALFIGNGQRGANVTNLPNGSTLPSDQSHVVLALRVFSWYRNSILRVAGAGAGEVALNGDYGNLDLWTAGGAALGQAPGQIQDVYRLHWQTEEQLHWSFGTGLKDSIFNMPTWYFPAGGGISGGAFNPAVGTGPTVINALWGGGHYNHLWLYIAGPLTGGLFAAIVFWIQEANSAEAA